MRVPRTLRAAAALVAFGLLASSSASAQPPRVWRVPTEIRSFRTAVQDSARPGDTIQVVGNGGATYPDRNVTINKDLTIQGGWRVDFRVRDPSTYVTVIRDTTSTAFTLPLLRVVGPVRVTLDGLWLWGGKVGILADGGPELVLRDCVIRNQRNIDASQDIDLNRGGGIRLVGGSALLERCRVTSIVTAFGGAGIAAISASSLVLRDTVVEGCISSRALGDASGAGIYVRDCGELRLERTTLSSSQTVQHGGLAFVQRTPLVAQESLFLDGLASTNGGALSLDAAAATFDDCVFERNRGIAGGALRALPGTSLLVRNCRFEGNRATDSGAAIWLSSATFTLEETVFVRNFQEGFPTTVIPRQGGAVYALSSTGTVTGGSFTGEKATGKGGAWFQIGGASTLSGARIDGCEAGMFGGAFAIELGGRIDLQRCLLVRTKARFGGAVAASFTGQVGLDRCTVTQGTARSAGAGIYVDTGGVVDVKDAIVCCALQGDLVYCAGGTVRADHCDVWNDDSYNIRVEWGGACPDPTGTDGNLRVDPGFCPSDPDFRIAPGSPCAGTASDGGDRGWLPAGCSESLPVGVRPRSWGRIKADWRGP